MKILVVDDDLELAGLIGYALRQAGYLVVDAADGPSALAAFEREAPSLVILDVNLPRLSGLEVCRQIRAGGSGVPIMMLTVRNAEEDQVQALDLGADDYITKPFEVRELVARMRAVMGRQSGSARSVLEAGGITLDMETHEVAFRGNHVLLPAREFALMRALMDRPGAILSREQIEKRLYGWGEEAESNAVDVLIHSVRKKFDKDIIQNVRGPGG